MGKTDLKIFYDLTRRGKLLGPVLSSDEVEGLAATLALCQARGLRAAETAYILATEYHETAGTMQPVKEFGGNGYFTRMYDIRGSRPTLAKANGNIHPGDGVKFCGRGKVQITWRGNYERVGKKIGVDLVNHPERACDMATATLIAVDGMIGGWFTGVGLTRYLTKGQPGTLASFAKARKIINGTDKAVLIAGYALTFQDDLVRAGWPL